MGRIPGPTCTDRLGAAWIDDGTVCRLRTSEQGVLGMVESVFVHYKCNGSDKIRRQLRHKS